MRASGIIPLKAHAVRKSYAAHGRHLDILKEAELNLVSYKIAALVGRSGSGKTTLLQIVGLLTPPDSGSVIVNGHDAWSLSDNERADLRRSHLGFMFQAFNLLPQHTALRNVALPYLGSVSEGVSRARRLLERVGLADRAEHRPSELSAGEQQRVALARALINDPPIVLADEPTGNLDAASEGVILSLFREAADEGRAVLLVTHSDVVAAAADTVLQMADGAPRPQGAAVGIVPPYSAELRKAP